MLSGDLDEYAIAALRADPVDVYGVGTSLVTGSGAPTAGMVYKLVAVDGRPVEKRSADKQSHGGRKSALRRHKASGTATEEVIFVTGGRPGARTRRPVAADADHARRALVDELPTLEDSREHLRRSLIGLPWEGLTISHGEPAIPTHPDSRPIPRHGTSTAAPPTAQTPPRHRRECHDRPEACRPAPIRR